MIVLFRTLFLVPRNVCDTFVLHATCGQQVATAPGVTNAEAQSG